MRTLKATYETSVDQNIGNVYSRKVYRGKRTWQNYEIYFSIKLRIAYLSTLILVECKYYKNKVEISDLLEFAQRIDDIGAHKGVVVSTVGFQEGAIKVADAHGIALVTTAPVWQTILYDLSPRGEPLAFTFGRTYVGGKHSPGRFAGVTITLLNAPVRKEAAFADAWKGIIDFLSVEIKCSSCGKIVKTWCAVFAKAFHTVFVRNAFSLVLN